MSSGSTIVHFRPISPSPGSPPTASGAEARTVGAAIDELAIPDLRTRVEHLAVVESVLSPKGPRYIARVEAPLGSGDRG